jgi:RND family efflux transporter MFP subunit
LIPTLLVAGILALGAWWSTHGVPSHAANSHEGGAGEGHAAASAVPVEVFRPKKGGLERITKQPGTVQAFETVQVYAEVSGYLKVQNVDYGPRVKGPKYDPVAKYQVQPGEILAVIDVPDLKEQVDRNKAQVEHAKAHVQLMKAKVTSAEAELKAAQAAVDQAKATRESARAARQFRNKQFIRYRELVGTGSVDERLVDEKEEQLHAATETENAAIAAINTAKAQVAAADAKVNQAKADVEDAKAEKGVAEADLRKAEVMQKFATIRAPFDGVVTMRAFFPSDFIRAAGGGGVTQPLYTLERLDKVRVVVQVPDLDVPYTNVGDPAIVEIDSLPGRKFKAQVARTAESEDPHTRLMHTEIDVDNRQGLLKQGMYGHVTIILQTGDPKSLTIPSSCLTSLPDSDEYGVYVVRDGKAHLVPVTTGVENGIQTEIVKGLKSDDLVVVNHGAVTEGIPVTASAAPPAGPKPTAAHH